MRIHLNSISYLVYINIELREVPVRSREGGRLVTSGFFAGGSTPPKRYSWLLGGRYNSPNGRSLELGPLSHTRVGVASEHRAGLRGAAPEENDGFTQ